MDYGFHHNIPTEVRLVKATKAILVPAPEPVLRSREVIGLHTRRYINRANGKRHYIDPA